MVGITTLGLHGDQCEICRWHIYLDSNQLVVDAEHTLSAVCDWRVFMEEIWYPECDVSEAREDGGKHEEGDGGGVSAQLDQCVL